MIEKYLYKTWLAFGVIQMTVVIGAGLAYSDDTLFSSGPDEQNSSANAVYPVRISRTLFEEPLMGKVTVKTADHAEQVGILEYSSNVSWQESPPTAPAPTGPYLADYRDFEGCARLEGLDSAKLCFTIMPDVSSVDLKEGRMNLSGLDRLPDCTGELRNLRFVKGDRLEQGLVVTYSALKIPAPGCPDEKQEGDGKAAFIEIRIERS